MLSNLQDIRQRKIKTPKNGKRAILALPLALAEAEPQDSIVVSYVFVFMV